MMPSGSNICMNGHCGYHFWGIHSHDSMWHLEIAAVAFKSYPFLVPTFAGSVLSGYNILMDLIVFVISLAGIPPIIMLFKIVPIIWFVLYTLIAITFSQKLKDSLLFIAITLFFLYFADHFGYILQLYYDGSIFKGSQSFGLQSMTALLNTQFALTLPIIMAQLILLKLQKFTFKNSLIMSVLVFFSMGLKFYGGIASLILAGFYVIDFFIQKKNFIRVLQQGSIILVGTLLSIIIFYNPFQATQSRSIFTISPFATVHSVIEAPDMVYLPDMVNARYFLYEHGWSPRLLYIELLSTALYMVINFGTRIFGVMYIIGKIIAKKAKRIEIYILLTVFLMSALSVLLIQKGDWWNTVQLSTFLLAIFIYDVIIHFKKVGIVIVVVIVIFTIPGTLRTISSFSSTDTLYISRQEIQAMEFLKKQPDGIVLNSFEAKEGYPFLDYRTSGYVAAFTGKQLYLAHLGPLNIIGVDFKKRLARVLGNDCSVFEEVDYIYYVKEHDGKLLESCLDVVDNDFLKVFENSQVRIFKRK